MIKLVFCDDHDYLKNKELVNAFKEVFSEEGKVELYYLTANYKVFRLNDSKWETVYEQSKLNSEPLENAYIFFDTKWDSPQEVVENSIIDWCEKNPNNYKKVLVYSTYSRSEADMLINYLRTKNINVLPESFFMISDVSFEQFAHFSRIFNIIKNDLIDYNTEVNDNA